MSFHSHLASFAVMELALDEAWEFLASPPQGGELPRVEDLDVDASPSHDPAPQRRGRPPGILLGAALRQLRDRVFGNAGAVPAAAAPDFKGTEKSLRSCPQMRSA